ncbi:FAD-dependent oxidoreductase [Methylobacterium oryzae CBMB20]
MVGGGVAGLSVALRLAPRPVTLVTASALGLGTATGWAQGGIARSGRRRRCRRAARRRYRRPPAPG